MEEGVGWKDYKSQRIREFSARLCLLVMSEAPHIVSHQQDCCNKRRAIDTLMWGVESSKELNFTKRTKGTKEC